MSNNATITLRLPGEDVDRAEALIDALSRDPRLRPARIGRSYVLRLALDLGLGVLEHEPGDGSPATRTPPKAPEPTTTAPKERKAPEPDDSAPASTFVRAYGKPSRLSKPATPTAARLREWRQREALTQTAAGKLLGRGQSTFSALETGKRKPTAEQAAKIQELSGIPVEDWTEEG